jgi:hypothetical protein
MVKTTEIIIIIIEETDVMVITRRPSLMMSLRWRDMLGKTQFESHGGDSVVQV